MSIRDSYQKIRKAVPDNVVVLIAAKTRGKEEVIEAIDAGARDIGYNYVQEAEEMRCLLGEKAKKLRWHMIGHLQANKINKALNIFDVIQTVDSLEKAKAIDKRAAASGRKKMPIYVEINIAKEEQKHGVVPDYEIIERLIREMSKLKHISVEGLMTMGPRTGNPEDSREYFQKAKEIFDNIKRLNLKNINLDVLSMGMSNSYKLAIEEGSNMIRLGRIIFED